MGGLNVYQGSYLATRFHKKGLRLSYTRPTTNTRQIIIKVYEQKQRSCGGIVGPFMAQRHGRLPWEDLFGSRRDSP